MMSHGPLIAIISASFPRVQQATSAKPPPPRHDEFLSLSFSRYYILDYHISLMQKLIADALERALRRDDIVSAGSTARAAAWARRPAAFSPAEETPHR